MVNTLDLNNYCMSPLNMKAVWYQGIKCQTLLQDLIKYVGCLINLSKYQVTFQINCKENGPCGYFLLTFTEIVGLAYVDADQRHELELTEPLPRAGWQGQEVAQVGYLGVDKVPAELASALGRLASVEPATADEESELAGEVWDNKSAL